MTEMLSTYVLLSKKSQGGGWERAGGPERGSKIMYKFDKEYKYTVH